MKKIERSLMERIFKYTCIVLLAMLLYCIPGFIAFKDLARQNGLYFITPQAWYWCIAGFVLFGVTFSLSRLSSRATTISSPSIWALS